MDPEDKKLLEETLELSKENNKMLHGLRRSQRIASFMRVAYWVVLIGISVGAFYLLDPYVDQLMEAYNGASDALKGFQN